MNASSSTLKRDREHPAPEPDPSSAKASKAALPSRLPPPVLRSLAFHVCDGRSIAFMFNQTFTGVGQIQAYAPSVTLFLARLMEHVMEPVTQQLLAWRNGAVEGPASEEGGAVSKEAARAWVRACVTGGVELPQDGFNFAMIATALARKAEDVRAEGAPHTNLLKAMLGYDENKDTFTVLLGELGALCDSCIVFVIEAMENWYKAHPCEHVFLWELEHVTAALRAHDACTSLWPPSVMHRCAVETKRAGAAPGALEPFPRYYFARDEEEPWWRDAGKCSALVQQWWHGLTGATFQPSPTSLLHTRLLHAYGVQGPSTDDSMFSLPAEDAFCVAMTDGAGTEHTVYIEFNDGCADANTGIFGRAFTREGIWVLFCGAEAGDCGTSVVGTDLGVDRYVEHEGMTLEGLLPEGSTWSENAYRRKHHVEYFCFAVAMLLRKFKTTIEASMPEQLRVRAVQSVLRIVQRRISEQGHLSVLPPPVWDIIAHMCPADLPSFCEPVHKAWVEGKRTKEALQRAVDRSLRYQRPGTSEDDDEEEMPRDDWPTCDCASRDDRDVSIEAARLGLTLDVLSLTSFEG